MLFFSEDGKRIEKHCLALGRLKTTKSLRDIPFSDSIAKMLKEYKLKQRTFIRNKNIIPTMVFLSEEGNYIDPSNVRKQYKKFIDSIGIPYIKFHALRHTYATRLLEASVHPKVAQELLGHSDMRITMRCL